MTITYTSLNLGDAVNVAVTAFPTFDKSTFALADSISDEKNFRREVILQKITGSEEFPMTARIGRYSSPVSNDGVGGVNTSVKVTTFVEKADADDVLWTKPQSVVIAVNSPGNSGVPDSDGLVELLCCAFSLMIPIVAGGVSAAFLDEVKFNVLNRVLEHVCSGPA